MVIPEKLKLNKFKLVTIPRNSKYVERFGYGITPDKAFSGDQEMPEGNKTDILQQMSRQLDAELSEED